MARRAFASRKELTDSSKCPAAPWRSASTLRKVDCTSYCMTPIPMLALLPHSLVARRINMPCVLPGSVLPVPGVIKETTGIEIPPDYHNCYKGLFARSYSRRVESKRHSQESAPVLSHHRWTQPLLPVIIQIKRSSKRQPSGLPFFCSKPNPCTTVRTTVPPSPQTLVNKTQCRLWRNVLSSVTG